ncbi:MAG: ATP-binding cassette domain-containing protein, partial [Pseudohongiella sp.]|nr:ATP-binding cassette domain-containing protein [Pseudohongiella sp.]
MTCMVEARHLCKRVTTSEGELVILSDINLSISAAETVAIVGASGSGKSTLLGLMAGLDSASSGDML